MRSISSLIGAVLVLAVAGAANGADQVRLSDEDFYKAIACGAPEGGRCASDMARWPEAVAQDLTVTIDVISSKFPAAKAKRTSRAAKRIITQINALGSGLHMRFVDQDPSADIHIYLAGKHRIDADTDFDRITVCTTQNNTLTPKPHVGPFGKVYPIVKAEIVVVQSINADYIETCLLHAVVESLGLGSISNNAYYDGRSIFYISDHLPVATALKGQDAMVLLRHYPK